MARPTPAGRPPAGVILLGLLIAIAVIGAGLAAAGTFWQETRQRALEEELLFTGQQYRRAIQRYFDGSPGGARQYPPSVEALLLDPRFVDIRRHLRRPWRDPLTGSTEWGVVAAPGGGIMGVYSLAPGIPRKRAGFPPELGWENSAAGGDERSYADWKFIYLPAQTGPATPVSAPVPAPPPAQ